jgi:hypothetical protein
MNVDVPAIEHCLYVRYYHKTLSLMRGIRLILVLILIGIDLVIGFSGALKAVVRIVVDRFHHSVQVGKAERTEKTFQLRKARILCCYLF